MHIENIPPKPSKEKIGILLLDCGLSFFPGNTAHKQSYPFPVEFKTVPGYTPERALCGASEVFDSLLETALKLQNSGVKAITGNCGFMAVHQKELSENISVPVFLSSLLQIPFMRALLPPRKKIGIITADENRLDKTVLKNAGVKPDNDLVVTGLQDMENFSSSVILGNQEMSRNKICDEVLEKTTDLLENNSNIAQILLECSILPSFGAEVQKATGLPVFDYNTMIRYVYSSVIKDGFL